MKHTILYLIAGMLLFTAACSKSESNDAKAPDMGTGQGGSLARFTTAMDHLYIVDHQKLYAYSLSNSAHPQLKGSTEIGFDIETIYSYKDKLFIGSRNAMYIYSISDAAHPSKLGEASHVRACDPVVANDSVAYVTVRSGSTCGGNISALYAYEIASILHPFERNAITLESPYGLGMNQSRLYVCNGSNGLNVYDISDKFYPALKKKITGDTFYDVIVLDNLLVCMVQGGTALYEMDNTEELKKVALIAN